MTCSNCGSDKLYFAVAGDKEMVVACKECMHIEQKDMTDEVKEEISKMMQGNVPWGEEGERG